MAIAAAVTLPFNPSMLPASLLGSTAPDWIEYILKFFGITIQHRGATHYLYIPISIIVLSFLVQIDILSSLLFWFGAGYLTHWIADSMTLSGVPISQFDHHKIHFFGGRLRTGDMMEYVIAFGLLLVSLTLVKPSIDFIDPKIQEFNPYYMNYRDLYNKKIIDEKTMRENRFKLF